MITVDHRVLPATHARPVRRSTIYSLPRPCQWVRYTGIYKSLSETATRCPSCTGYCSTDVLRTLRLELHAHWGVECWCRSSRGGGVLHLPHGQFVDDNMRQVVEAYVRIRFEELLPECFFQPQKAA